MKRFADFLQDRRGGISVLAAFGSAIALGAVAMAVDLGSLFADSRRLQGIADAAALAAAADLPRMNEEAAAAAAASGWNRTVGTSVMPGRWNNAQPAAQRFIPNDGSPNAAKVTATIRSPLYFARAIGLNGVAITRYATAARIDLVSFSIGSRLASVDAGIANKLLSGLTGGNVSLGVMDYTALASADVDLLAFTDALRANGTALSFDQLLTANTGMTQAANAVATVLDASGAGTAAAAARAIATAAAASPAIPLSRLIDLGALGRQDRTSSGPPIRVNAFDLLRSMIALSGGARQVSLDLGATVQGLSSVTVRVAIGDRPAQSPWVAVAADGGTIVRTAQTRLFVEAQAGTPISLLGLGSVFVRLPLYAEIAEAQAKLSSLTCGSGTRAVTLLGQTSPGHASIAEVATGSFADQQTALAETPARFVTIGTTRVTGQIRADMGGSSWQIVPFTTAEVDARATHTIDSSGTAAALGASMINAVAVGVSVGGLYVSNPVLTATVGAVLTTMAPLVDGVIGQLTGLLGVHLGQADLRIAGVRCGTASLVA